MTLNTFPHFAAALKHYRMSCNFTQETLAEKSGVSLRSISDLERGVSRSPRKDTVQLLAKAMQLSDQDVQVLVSSAAPSDHSGVGSLALSQNDPPLIGREKDVREILSLLTTSAARLLTLTGAAGIGKTRLVLACAAQLRETFPGDIVLVDLAAITAPRFALSAVCAALELREQPQYSLQDTIINAIADRSTLLILDNCEHVLEARGSFEALLDHCPNVKILAASREKLNITNETILQVQPLAIPKNLPKAEDAHISDYPAVTLFLTCARMADPNFAPLPAQLRAIAKICMLLDGVPLAIELAASRVPALTPRAILEQLSTSAPSILKTWLRAERTHADSRQQTLHNAFLWSYQLLTPREQIAFRRLSVFPDGWTLEAAEAAVASQNAAELDEILVSLQEKSLITRDLSDETTERFRMRFVVRTFGVEILKERKEYTAAAHAIAEWYAAMAERLEQELTGANQAESLRRLIEEQENIRAALQWSREQDAIAIGLRIAGSLWWFWENRGEITEGREWLEGMLTQWRRRLIGVDNETVTRVYYGATVLAILQGDVAKAETFAQECLTRKISPEKHARMLLLQGNLAKRRGDKDGAFAYYSQGLTILRAANDTKGLLVALNNLSALLIERGEIEHALELLQESFALKRAIGDQRGIAVGYINLGEAYKTQQNFLQARSATQEALTIFLDLGDIQGITIALSNLGEIADAMRESEAAVAAYTGSMEYAQRMEDRSALAQTLWRLGNVLAKQRQTQAITHLRESAQIFRELNDNNGAANATADLAAFLADLGEWQAAAEELTGIASLLPCTDEATRHKISSLQGKIQQRSIAISGADP